MQIAVNSVIILMYFYLSFVNYFDSSRVEYCFIQRVQCKYLNILGHSNEYRVNKYSINSSNRIFFTFFSKLNGPEINSLKKK